MKKKLLAVAALAAITLGGTATADPIPALSQGDSATFTITDNGFGGYDLIASGSVTVSLLDATHLDLLVTLNNISTNDDGSAITAANASNVRLAVWGFAITPNVTGVTFVDSADNGMVGAALGSIPSQSAIEVCAFGQNCSSGANLGILANGSDSFELDMTGAFTGFSSITLDLLGVKWQTNNGSFEFSCADCGSSSGGNQSSSGDPTSSGGTGQVPEPRSSALVLLGLGLLAATFGWRRGGRRA